MAHTTTSMATDARGARTPWRVRSPAAWLLAALLTGCAGMGLKESPPSGTDLSGTWKLDPAHSTDSHRVLAELARARTRRPQEGQATRVAPGAGPRGPATGSSAQQSLEAQLRIPVEDVGPDISLQTEELSGGEYLRIVQKPGEITFRTATRTRTFTPGARSVVSVPDGVADQRSGWKGREYRILIHPQEGPKVEERFRRSDDGRQLIETIHIAADGRIPRVEVTRVYVPARELPIVLPSGD